MGNRDRRDGSGGAEPRCDRWEQLVRALDAGHAGLVPAVAALEAAASDQPGGGEPAVGALDDVVERPAGVGLGRRRLKPAARARRAPNLEP